MTMRWNSVLFVAAVAAVWSTPAKRTTSACSMGLSQSGSIRRPLTEPEERALIGAVNKLQNESAPNPALPMRSSKTNSAPNLATDDGERVHGDRFVTDFIPADPLWDAVKPVFAAWAIFLAHRPTLHPRRIRWQAVVSRSAVSTVVCYKSGTPKQPRCQPSEVLGVEIVVVRISL